MIDLDPRQRRELRAKAHHLHAVVRVGHHGLTPAVLNEIDLALTAHALVKVRVHSDDRDEREAMLADACARLQAAPVQHLGKLLILWRPRDEDGHEAAATPRKPRKAAKSPAQAPAKVSGARGPAAPKSRAAAAAAATERRRRRPVAKAPLGTFTGGERVEPPRPPRAATPAATRTQRGAARGGAGAQGKPATRGAAPKAGSRPAVRPGTRGAVAAAPRGAPKPRRRRS